MPPSPRRTMQVTRVPIYPSMMTAMMNGQPPLMTSPVMTEIALSIPGNGLMEMKTARMAIFW